MAGMVVQHNMNALNAYNRLNVNVNGLKKSSEKLSSGYRINRAGDDAAGLAISEKMRSQIRGLNQAKRNSQDGISMIQTFEGALQESHSILQRMKELAAESANGTYDNATDRAAIQLEFDQLNDELNQIADTDFNGTIVLNGGEMADGLKAVNGEFNYKEYVRDPQQLDSSFVTVIDGQNADDSDTAVNMDGVWAKLNTNWNRTDASVANDGPESVDVEITYDATGGDNGTTFWKVTGATNGAVVENITATSTRNGGFTLKTTTGNIEIAKTVIDQNSLTNGDKVVLTLNNPKNSQTAATLAGAEVSNDSMVAGVKTTAFDTDDIDITVAVDAVADTDATKVTDAIYNIMDGATFTQKITANTAATDTDSSLSIKLTDDNNTELKSAANTVQSLEVYVDGEKVKLGYQFDGTDGTFKIGLLNAAGDAIGTNLMTITASKVAADTTNDTAGTKSWTIGVEHSSFDDSNKANVELKEPADASVSHSNSFTKSEAIMTYTDNITLQTGARTKDSVNFTFKYNTDGSADMGDLKANLNCSARADGLNTANLSLASQEDANYAIDQIDKAINKVSMVRASFGSIQNRLEHKIENITTTAENLTEAESTIRDTDMASEMMNYTKFNILQQAAQSMLAQANQQPQGILQLLG